MAARNGGFTLIELMTALALAAVLQSLAAPVFADLIGSVRVSTGVNALLSSLVMARSEAIKRHGRAVICKSASGQTCSASGGWEQGWLVFHDANNNSALDPGEAVLLRQPAMPAPVRVLGNAPLARYVSFTPQGTTEYVSGAFQAGTLTVCAESARSVPARQIVISSSGRMRAVRTQLSGCG